MYSELDPVNGCTPFCGQQYLSAPSIPELDDGNSSPSIDRRARSRRHSALDVVAKLERTSITDSFDALPGGPAAAKADPSPKVTGAATSIPDQDDLNTITQVSAKYSADESPPSAPICTPASIPSTPRSSVDNGSSLGASSDSDFDVLYARLKMVDLLQDNALSLGKLPSKSESSLFGIALLDIADRTTAKILDEHRVAFKETVVAFVSEIDDVLNGFQSRGQFLAQTLKSIRQEFEMLKYERDVLNAEREDLVEQITLMKSRLALQSLDSALCRLQSHGAAAL